MATRDYKARERTRPKRARRGGSGFFWFVTGAVFGAFGIGLAWTLQDQASSADVSSPQTRVEPTTKPSFVFHQLLPEMEVLVPDEELNAAVPPKAGPKPPPQGRPREAKKPESQEPTKSGKPTNGDASYLIQVASFRKASDATQLKAKLALLGLRARIQQVNVNGKSYHRVHTGPYKSKQAVNETRALLSSNGYESMAVKLK